MFRPDRLSYSTLMLQLHGQQHTGILVPGQQRVLSVPRFRVLDVRPAVDKVFVADNLGQFPGDRPVEILDDIEVRWEENIKVSLLDL